MNTKNFYIIATASNDPSLQVRISGPYPTRQTAEADLASAIQAAETLDPSARKYQYCISQVKSQKPGIIQHMAANQ